MTTGQPFEEFLEAVETLRDNEPVRMTAHTSNAATETWRSPAPTTTDPDATPQP
ncbi:hypothetical protein [Streptomyces sp. CBMA152]|uniref:hypothetical protein n=1 Tax=Streptomyces sp. CBMA152 TaxID=1896312 RepID=UPI0016610A4C|nr:hypothetical protein [Streptomyces sp. CBMA152]